MNDLIENKSEEERHRCTVMTRSKSTANNLDEKKPAQVKGSDVKRTRRDRGEIEDIMFKLFERQPNWTLKQLVQETDQPANTKQKQLRIVLRSANLSYASNSMIWERYLNGFYSEDPVDMVHDAYVDNPTHFIQFAGGNYSRNELDEVRAEWAECLQDYVACENDIAEVDMLKWVMFVIIIRGSYFDDNFMDQGM
ncbi:Transcription initiation factor IIF [Perilla frutescens var. hirtella]|nr:Transcription initiation factor IIF [Perilla frutescens var. frutescens]KAH6776503.1 Transcription initiation factor IIF [Perilla frutescens var. hirtella]